MSWSSTSPTVVTSTYNPGTATSLLAGKITWRAGGAPDEFHLFNITDLANEPSEASAIASITNLDLDQSAIDTIAIWDTNNAITDEIRFATTFGEAMGLIEHGVHELAIDRLRQIKRLKVRSKIEHIVYQKSHVGQ